ncbi:MAG: hypothetical protein SCH39_10635 [Methanosarcinales archaeon]|nr:hypothetical protein [Methanosarcinales archaeon]
MSQKNNVRSAIQLKRREKGFFIKMTEMTKMTENPYYATYLWRNSVTEGE